MYQEAVSLGKNNADEEKWKKAIFWVFDAPDMANQPFEERIQHLHQLQQQNKLPSFVKVVEAITCQNKQHLEDFYTQVLAKGGEGVMLRDPQAKYAAERSSSMRKYKPFFDTEVKVVENNYPHGFKCVL